MGVAGPIIGGIGTIAGISSSNSQAKAQAAAAADQQAMLAKQAFYNSLALNAAQTNLAYDYDTADMQQRAADIQAVQQNFQNLMAGRQQFLNTSGQIDQGRFQAQQQYFDSLFNQGQQSTATVFQSSQDANNRLFGAGVEGLQGFRQVTEQGMGNMFQTAVGAMNREQQASSQGLANTLQAGVQGINSTRDTALAGAKNVFDTSNQFRDQYTQTAVAGLNSQTQGYQESLAAATQLEEQTRQIQAQQEQITQQQSALTTIYSSMVGGGNIRDTLAGQRQQEQAGQQSINSQQALEQQINSTLGQTQRNADYRTEQLDNQLGTLGVLGDISIQGAADVANINNQSAQNLALLSNLNALGNYARDTSFARSQGALETGQAANDFVRNSGNYAQQNQMNLDYTKFQNDIQSGFLSDFLPAYDAYVKGQAGANLQGANANLNALAMQALQQRQAGELAYGFGNYNIGATSQGNMLANLIAMQTGISNASLQSDAQATLNQAQQAQARLAGSQARGAGIGDYLQGAYGIISPFLNRGQGQSNGFGFTPYNQSNIGYNPSSTGSLFGYGSLYGSNSPSVNYSYGGSPLTPGTFQAN